MTPRDEHLSPMRLPFVRRIRVVNCLVLADLEIGTHAGHCRTNVTPCNNGLMPYAPDALNRIEHRIVPPYEPCQCMRILSSPAQTAPVNWRRVHKGQDDF